MSSFPQPAPPTSLRAYLFAHHAGARHLGHVGWAVQLPGGPYLCGSTENTGPHRIVPPGGDITFWTRDGVSEAELLSEMARSHGARPGHPNGYDAYKWALVHGADPSAARQAAEQVRAGGYNLLDNNCLHHARRILRAYGVPAGAGGLASPLTHPGPNAWFAASLGEAWSALA